MTQSAQQKTQGAQQTSTAQQASHPEKSPWAVPVAQILNRPGESKHIDMDFPAPSGIGDEFYGIPEGTPIAVEGDLDSIADGLVFTGTATAPITGKCSRCLKDISHDETIDVTAFMPKKTTASEEGDRTGRGAKREETIDTSEALQDEAEDVYPLVGNAMFADFEALLRDDFDQVIPVAPLCEPDCKGLCPQCGINLNENPDHHHETHDIRWDALAGLKAQLEQQERSAK